MVSVLEWIKKNKGKTIFICLLLFILPLVVVHFLFKLHGPGWLVAEWTAGDVLGYVAGFEAFLGTVALGALALWQNAQIHKEHIDSLEPCLSMELICIDGFLFLVIKNTGAVEAKEIRIVVKGLEQNGSNNVLMLDELFSNTFDLYPKEVIQGQIALSGANLVTRVFPKVTIEVSYLRPDLNRTKQYERTVTYNTGYDARILADVNYDSGTMESDIDAIARANVRMANYLDGHQALKADKLNILSNRSLQNDLCSAIKAKQEEPIMDRKDVIDNNLPNN